MKELGRSLVCLCYMFLNLERSREFLLPPDFSHGEVSIVLQTLNFLILVGSWRRAPLSVRNCRGSRYS